MKSSDTKENKNAGPPQPRFGMEEPAFYFYKYLNLLYSGQGIVY